MQRTISALGGLISLTLLAGCASGTDGGLSSTFGPPAEAPPAPATQAPFPAVHDVPPARSTTPLTPEEQLRMERDLAAARARQEKLR